MVDFAKMSTRKKNKRTSKEVDVSIYTEGLTEDQNRVFLEMVAFLDKADDSMFCMKGYAGTGKTFVITRFIQYCLQLTRQNIKTWVPMANHKHGRPIIAMTAPTNKAVQVLRESSDKSLFGVVEFSTIHKLLGLKEVINAAGEQEFRNDNKFKAPPIEAKDILIIDEVSMLNDDLFVLIKNYATTIKIIMLGDPKQIPPVGKEDCEPFLNPEQHKIITSELSQIMRQKEGSSIIEASMHIRNNILNDKYNFSAFVGLERSDFSIYKPSFQRGELEQLIREKVLSDEFIENPSCLKIIAWRNVKVDEYNRYIRKIFGGRKWPDIDMATADKILVGDRMIANKPVTRDNGSGLTEIQLHTNQEFEVMAITRNGDEQFEYSVSEGVVKVHTLDVGVKYYDAESDSYLEKNIRVLHESSAKYVQQLLNSLKSAALKAPTNKRGWWWKEYYAFERQFANISYAYAITAHKSQGSTYNEVVVDANDISINPNIVERNRILYTAVTRAKSNLILIN